jgi:signal transduction histidine kinase
MSRFLPLARARAGQLPFFDLKPGYDDRHGFDIVVAIAAAAGVLEVVFGRDETQAPRTTLWFTVPAVALVVFPLIARRWFPFAAPALLWLLAATVSLVDGRLVVFAKGVFLAGLAASFLLGNLRDARQQRLGLAVVLGAAAVVVYQDPNHSAGELVFTPLLFAIAWLLGFALRQRVEETEAATARATQAEQEREIAARLAVAEERARIARELHDIVAHAVSVMVLQVGAVRHNLPEELAQDRDALQDVESTGRAALSQMRRLLGAMRSERDELELTPQPGVCCLEPLLDEIRRTGLNVELHVEGEQVPLPGALDLSAYRIVQEGLTNALEIEVRDDGRGPSTSDGLGHGLVGIRERVKLYGGQMSAGAASGRGFVLSTRLPLVGGEQ